MHEFEWNIEGRKVGTTLKECGGASSHRVRQIGQANLTSGTLVVHDRILLGRLSLKKNNEGEKSVAEDKHGQNLTAIKSPISIGGTGEAMAV
jgi:hypothetical protein